MLSLSLCMIVKDEEEYLAQCLDSVNGLVDEIIVVDTGSKDKTVEIAKKFNAKVIHHEWNNDTSEARNISLKNATKDWILVLDADEFLTEKEMKLIKEIINENKYDAVRLIQHNYVNDVNHGGFRSLDNDDKNYGKYVGWFPIPIIRLFRNREDIYFESKIHEIVDNSIEKCGMKLLNSNIHFYHYGFVRGGRKKRKDKHYSDLADATDEDEPRVLYLKGVSYSKNKQATKAIECFEKAIKQIPNNLQLAYVLGEAYLEIDEVEKAIDVLEKSTGIKGEDAETFDNQDCYVDLYTNLGAAYMKKGLPDKALSVLKKGLQYGGNPKIYNNLSAISMSLNKPKDALVYISNALKIAPNDLALLANFASILARINKEHAIMVYKRLIELDKDNKIRWEKKIAALT